MKNTNGYLNDLVKDKVPAAQPVFLPAPPPPVAPMWTGKNYGSV